jgi:hypothetical protein
VIRDVATELDLSTALAIAYAGIAAAVASGGVLGIAAIWLSTAVRGR